MSPPRQQPPSHRTELWASGFNAHGQLQRVDSPIAVAAGTLDSSAGQDIVEFRRIASGDHIEVVYAGWCQTVLFIDGFLTVLSAPLSSIDKNVASPSDGSHTPHETRPPFLQPLNREKLSHAPVSAFGTDTAGLQGFINPDTGTLCTLDSAGTLTTSNTTIEANQPPAAIATTSTGQTAIAHHPAANSPTFTLTIYPTLPPLLSSTSPSTTTSTAPTPATKHTLPGTPTHLAATATAFLLLTADGTLWSLGDPRHPHVLGRPCTPGAPPATVPAPLAALVGCSVAKVAAGGWVGACVSAAGEAWLWGGGGPGGGGGGGGGGVITALKGGAGEVVRIEAPREAGGAEEQEDDDEFEVVDIAVGDGHVLMLDGKGRVWGGGRGAEGQLGSAARRFEEDWVRILGFGTGVDGDGDSAGWRVRGVACGDLTSFVLLESVDSPSSG